MSVNHARASSTASPLASRSLSVIPVRLTILEGRDRSTLTRNGACFRGQARPDHGNPNLYDEIVPAIKPCSFQVNNGIAFIQLHNLPTMPVNVLRN